MDPHTFAASALAATLAVVTVGYGLRCWLKPFRPCRRCQGTGTRPAAFTGRARDCRPCKGTGLRLRTGRRAANYLRRNIRSTR
ncbi:hypothetical protein [Catellatospora chokoriensis]|uniref:Uncharacterized protein n=1 Tax=Catellatospora chokoriensis TaxID=310353 RepID=A0A8J3K620_9ACTN|nr:hypothetical protein [Catellatospora chokoriensis]GIF91380.1 hypothetical protein Cch02nite_48240 [Catellatospora chokoriensis]